MTITVTRFFLRSGGLYEQMKKTDLYLENTMSWLPHDFFKKIAHSLEEEEVDIFTMTLYCMSSDDMNYFNEKDRERVKGIFKILMDDTKRHAELLKSIVEVGGH